MAEKNRISVIIAAFNVDKYLQEVLDSIFNQTRPADEIIVVDDGSTDDTWTIIEANSSKIKHIRLIENKGCSVALNVGINASSHELICFLDADDIWKYNKLEVQSALLSSNKDIDIVFGMSSQFVCPSLSEYDKALIKPLLGLHPGYIKSCMMVRRKVFDEFGLFDESLRGGDFIEWFQRIKEEGITFQIHPDHVHMRRLTRSSLSSRDESSSSILKFLKLRIDKSRSIQ